MKILITGANGQLGYELSQYKTTHQLIALPRQELDITKTDNVANAFTEHAPDLVINAAAYTAVDKAESDAEQAYAVNRDGAKCLAENCAKDNTPMIHVSTDYVFDGTKTGPYHEDEQVMPLGIYGKSKWEGEQAIREILPQHIILRVSWVYGIQGNNFVKTILRLAKEREQLSIVQDQIGCPTETTAITAAIFQIIETIGQRQHKWGTYHFCNGPTTNWYEFSKAIVSIASDYSTLKLREINPITTAEYPTPAQRPMNSVLDCKKLTAAFMIEPQAWTELLPKTVKEICET